MNWLECVRWVLPVGDRLDGKVAAVLMGRLLWVAPVRDVRWWRGLGLTDVLIIAGNGGLRYSGDRIACGWW